MKVVIVDYGRGNLLSIQRALKHVGADSVVTSRPEDIASAERLLLPGVGAFADGMAGLRDRGLVEPLRRFAASGRPLLGICLGMQLLLDESEEFGRHEGLGIVKGRVALLPSLSPDDRRFKVPHIGWNVLLRPEGRSWDRTPLERLGAKPYAYFVHSYAAMPDDPAHRLAETSFAGRRFCSALAAGSVAGCQFHPEKSGEDGLRVLHSWLSVHKPLLEVS